MKHTKRYLLLLLATFPLLLFSQEKRTTVKTQNVIVFLNGAQITAETTISIPAGSSEVILEKLPEYISEEQLQVKGEGDFIIQSVVRKMNYLNDNQHTKEVQALRDSLEILAFEMEKEKGMEKIYNQEEELLMANKSIGGNNNGVNVVELGKVADFVRNRLIELQNKRVKTHKRQKELQEQMNRINNQLSQMNNKANNRSSEVVISVSSNTAQKAKFIVSYFVSQAGWAPYYDIRATDSDSPLKLEYKANVWQSTGYDWSGVKLTLSTGNPYIQNDKPEMNPTRLSFDSPIVMYKLKSRGNSDVLGFSRDEKKLDSSEGYLAEESNNLAQKAESSAQYTQITQGETNLTFEINIPYSVPSDGQKYAVAVQEFDIPAKYKYYTAPKLDADAFLVAYVTDWEKYNLMSTNANVYFEGMYVGKTYINTANTDDTLQFSLGRDKNISVKREKLQDLSAKKTIGLSKKETYAYEITVKNKKNKDIEIVLQDQIPVSGDKDIVVELLDKSKADYNAEKGFLIWEFKIKSGKSETVKFSYSIQYPKDKKIYEQGF